MYVISINRDTTTNSSCSFPFFLKNLTCKHVLGMLIRLKLVGVPVVEAKNVPLDQRRKRGRPTRTKKALLAQ